MESTVRLAMLKLLQNLSDDCSQAEALFAKKQLEEELDVARLVVAALNVEWDKFVDKGVQALPLSRKTKKAAAARAKKIVAATTAAAELEAAKKQQEEVILCASTAIAEADDSTRVEASGGDHSVAGTGTGNGDGDSAPKSPDPLDRAISGVLASADN